jgi:hypothetical protein
VRRRSEGSTYEGYDEVDKLSPSPNFVTKRKGVRSLSKILVAALNQKMPSCHLTPNDDKPFEFHGYLLNEFSNSSTPGSTISNEERIVSPNYPSTFSSPSSTSFYIPLTVGSNYKTHFEYCPSPNVHPLKMPSEASSPLSIFSPSFAQTSLFSSPGAKSSRKYDTSTLTSIQKLARERDQVLYASPSRTTKKMRNSDSNMPQISQFNQTSYATLPLSERLAPQKENEIFLSIPHRSSIFTGTKDLQNRELSTAHFQYHRDMPTGGKPYVATSSHSRYESIDGIPTGDMLKRRINAVNVILQSTAIVHDRKRKECSSNANPEFRNKLAREKGITYNGNSKIRTKSCKNSSFKAINGNCIENSEIIDRNDLTSVAVSLLNMASGYDTL